MKTSHTCRVVDVLNEAGVGALSAPRGRVQQHKQDEEYVKDCTRVHKTGEAACCV